MGFYAKNRTSFIGLFAIFFILAGSSIQPLFANNLSKINKPDQIEYELAPRKSACSKENEPFAMRTAMFLASPSITKNMPPFIINSQETCDDQLFRELNTSIDSLITVAQQKGALKKNVIPAISFGNVNQIVYQNQPTKTKLFDIASITKAIATAPGIFILQQQKRLSVNDDALKHLPEALTSKLNKTLKGVKISDLLLHKSCFDDVYYERGIKIDSINALFNHIAQSKKTSPPCATTYSDINYILLGEIIKHQSKQKNLAQFFQEEIFDKIGMNNTKFSKKCSDPTARLFHCEAGNAGLFSTAQDLSLFAQTILNNGVPPGKPGKYLFTKESIDAMTQTPPENKQTPNDKWQRGMGFDLNTEYSCSPAGHFFSSKSFGHTGWGGNALWMDPVTKRFLVILPKRNTNEKFDAEMKFFRTAIADKCNWVLDKYTQTTIACKYANNTFLPKIWTAGPAAYQAQKHDPPPTPNHRPQPHQHR